jgi:pimeloyl-ACP methyl ester carboxylesterase
VIVALAVAVLLLTGVAYLAYRSVAGLTPSGVQVVAEEACPFSEFTCVTLRVPRDHADPTGATMEVTFARLPATGERQGVFVTAVGGPGASGIALADGYTAVFDPAIREAYDTVFFDQRGIGMSEPIDCLDAALAYYGSDAVPTVSEADAAAFAQVARTFSAECVAETGVESVGFDAYATDQAAEDLEHFRRWLGVEQLHLYGESYGTQFVQVYAAAHPDRVAALMLDGPVDLTLEGTDYWIEGALSFEATLVHTMESCDELCTSDVEGGDLLAAWDALATELAAGPATFTLTLGDGTREPRDLSLADLETAAAAHVYDTFDQMLLQRAVAYAARGDLAAMARLVAIGLGVDIETLEGFEDPTWSDALYFAVQCADYAYGTGSADEREAAYFTQGAVAGIDAHRLGSVYYGDLPCASWPVHAEGARPVNLTTGAYPILVLASTTDPATPYAGAQRIFEAAGDGYLVTQPGGPHVLFGRGNPCPDDLVTALLVDGTLPDERETTCEPMGPDPYYPIPPAAADADADPLVVMGSIDDEINLSPDYWLWTGEKALKVGCLHGGTLRYEVNENGSSLTLDACEMVGGLPLTGSGQIDDVAGSFALDVTGPEGSVLAYNRTPEGDLSVTGTWFGETVDLEG